MTNSYVLQLYLGNNLIGNIPSMLEHFSIVQDINSLLPTCRIKLTDSGDGLNHLAPLDNNFNTIRVSLKQSMHSEITNEYSFAIFRRYPKPKLFDASCILNVPNVFTPQYCRGFGKKNARQQRYRGTVKQIIEDIAVYDLGFTNTEVSTSLNYNNNLLQPNITNAELLVNLAQTLQGAEGESGYYCFATVAEGKKIFHFKHINEILNQIPKYKFYVSPDMVDGHLPIIDYKIYDNYRLFKNMGLKQQAYGYFDYATGTYVDTNVDYTGLHPLAQYHMMNANEPNDSANTPLGRNTDFTEDFVGRVGGDYYKRLNGLTKMWITTYGLGDIKPSDIVSILFGDAMVSGQLNDYLYQGDWLVEKVVHLIGQTHITKLLLSRNGVDTTKETTLLRAIKR